MSAQPPFPYFGGKRRASPQVWAALGAVSRYVEPFMGAAAVALQAPRSVKSVLVNDLSHYVANFWRACQSDPETIERLASAPCSEVELRAVHAWLESEGAERLAGLDWSDLSACDAEVAGRWLWRQCVSVKGNGDLARGNHGAGVKSGAVSLLQLACARASRWQVMCGDWQRCVTNSALMLAEGATGTVGVFLDPPYGEGSGVQYEDGTGDAARDSWAWAVEHASEKLRIVAAGYDDGREVPSDWTTIERVEKGGYANGSTDNENRHRERLWLSPHCVGGTANRGMLL